jgi:hypothetical protein
VAVLTHSIDAETPCIERWAVPLSSRRYREATGQLTDCFGQGAGEQKWGCLQKHFHEKSVEPQIARDDKYEKAVVGRGPLPADTTAVSREAHRQLLCVAATLSLVRANIHAVLQAVLASA